MNLDYCNICLETVPNTQLLRTIYIYNIYNFCLLFTTAIKGSSTLRSLSEALLKIDKYIIIENFNLYYLYWENRIYLFRHLAANTIMDIAAIAKLKLATFVGTIIRVINR